MRNNKSTMHLLPSDVARLVLGYLKEKCLKKTFVAFLQESPDLSEYWRMINAGLMPTTAIMGMTLQTILEEYTVLSMRVKALASQLAELSDAQTSQQRARPTTVLERHDIDAVIKSHKKAELDKKRRCMRQKVRHENSIKPRSKSSERNEPSSSLRTRDRLEHIETFDSSYCSNALRPEGNQVEKSSDIDDLEDEFEFDSLDRLLADTKLHEKLAESINKALKRDQGTSSDRLNTSTDTVKKKVIHPLDESGGNPNVEESVHKNSPSGVAKQNIDDIISMTADEPGLEQLLSLFQFQPEIPPHNALLSSNSNNNHNISHSSAALYLPTVGSATALSDSSPLTHSIIPAHQINLHSPQKQKSCDVANTQISLSLSSENTVVSTCSTQSLISQSHSSVQSSTSTSTGTVSYSRDGNSLPSSTHNTSHSVQHSCDNNILNGTESQHLQKASKNNRTSLSPCNKSVTFSTPRIDPHVQTGSSNSTQICKKSRIKRAPKKLSQATSQDNVKCGQIRKKETSGENLEVINQGSEDPAKLNVNSNSRNKGDKKVMDAGPGSNVEYQTQGQSYVGGRVSVADEERKPVGDRVLQSHAINLQENTSTRRELEDAIERKDSIPRKETGEIDGRKYCNVKEKDVDHRMESDDFNMKKETVGNDEGNSNPSSQPNPVVVSHPVLTSSNPSQRSTSVVSAQYPENNDPFPVIHNDIDLGAPQPTKNSSHKTLEPPVYGMEENSLSLFSFIEKNSAELSGDAFISEHPKSHDSFIADIEMKSKEHDEPISNEEKLVDKENLMLLTEEKSTHKKNKEQKSSESDSCISKKLQTMDSLKQIVEDKQPCNEMKLKNNEKDKLDTKENTSKPQILSTSDEMKSKEHDEPINNEEKLADKENLMLLTEENSKHKKSKEQKSSESDSCISKKLLTMDSLKQIVEDKQPCNEGKLKNNEKDKLDLKEDTSEPQIPSINDALPAFTSQTSTRNIFNRFDSNSSFGQQLSTPNAVLVKPLCLYNSRLERNFHVVDTCLQNILGDLEVHNGETSKIVKTDDNDIEQLHKESETKNCSCNSDIDENIDDADDDNANEPAKNNAVLDEESEIEKELEAISSESKRVLEFDGIEDLHNCSATISTPFVTKDVAASDDSPRKLVKNQVRSNECVSMPASLPSLMKEKDKNEFQYKSSDDSSAFSPSAIKFKKQPKRNFSPVLPSSQHSRKIIACDMTHSPFIPSHCKKKGPSRRITPMEVSFSTPSPLQIMSPSSPADFIIDLAHSPSQPNTPAKEVIPTSPANEVVRKGDVHLKTKRQNRVETENLHHFVLPKSNKDKNGRENEDVHEEDDKHISNKDFVKENDLGEKIVNRNETSAMQNENEPKEYNFLKDVRKKLNLTENDAEKCVKEKVVEEGDNSQADGAMEDFSGNVHACSSNSRREKELLQGAGISESQNSMIPSHQSSLSGNASGVKLPTSPSERKPRRVIPTLISKTVSKVNGDGFLSPSSSSRNGSLLCPDESKIVSSSSDPPSPHSEEEAFRLLKTFIYQSYSKPQPNQEITSSNTTGRLHSSSIMQKCGCLSREVCTHVKGKGRKSVKKLGVSYSRSKDKDSAIINVKKSCLDKPESGGYVSKVGGDVVCDSSSKDDVDNYGKDAISADIESSRSSGTFIPVGIVDFNNEEDVQNKQSCPSEQEYREKANNVSTGQLKEIVTSHEQDMPRIFVSSADSNNQKSRENETTDGDRKKEGKNNAEIEGNVKMGHRNSNEKTDSNTGNHNINGGQGSNEKKTSHQSPNAKLLSNHPPLEFDDHHENISLAAPYFPELSNTMDFFKLRKHKSSETNVLDTPVPGTGPEHEMPKSNDLQSEAPAHLDLNLESCLNDPPSMNEGDCLAQAMKECGIEPSELSLMDNSQFTVANYKTSDNIMTPSVGQEDLLTKAVREAHKSINVSQKTKSKKKTSSTPTAIQPQRILRPSNNDTRSSLQALFNPSTLAGKIAYYQQPSQPPVPFIILSDGQVVVLPNSYSGLPPPPVSSAPALPVPQILVTPQHPLPVPLPPALPRLPLPPVPLSSPLLPPLGTTTQSVLIQSSSKPKKTKPVSSKSKSKYSQRYSPTLKVRKDSTSASYGSVQKMAVRRKIGEDELSPRKHSVSTYFKKPKKCSAIRKLSLSSEVSPALKRDVQIYNKQNENIVGSPNQSIESDSVIKEVSVNSGLNSSGREIERVHVFEDTVTVPESAQNYEDTVTERAQNCEGTGTESKNYEDTETESTQNYEDTVTESAQIYEDTVTNISDCTNTNTGVESGSEEFEMAVETGENEVGKVENTQEIFNGVMDEDEVAARQLEKLCGLTADQCFVNESLENVTISCRDKSPESKSKNYSPLDRKNSESKSGVYDKSKENETPMGKSETVDSSVDMNTSVGNETQKSPENMRAEKEKLFSHLSLRKKPSSNKTTTSVEKGKNTTKVSPKCVVDKNKSDSSLKGEGKIDDISGTKEHNEDRENLGTKEDNRIASPFLPTKKKNDKEIDEWRRKSFTDIIRGISSHNNSQYKPSPHKRRSSHGSLVMERDVCFAKVIRDTSVSVMIFDGGDTIRNVSDSCIEIVKTRKENTVDEKRSEKNLTGRDMKDGDMSNERKNRRRKEKDNLIDDKEAKLSSRNDSLSLSEKTENKNKYNFNDKDLWNDKKDTSWKEKEAEPLGENSSLPLSDKGSEMSRQRKENMKRKAEIPREQGYKKRKKGQLDTEMSSEPYPEKQVENVGQNDANLRRKSAKRERNLFNDIIASSQKDKRTEEISDVEEMNSEKCIEDEAFDLLSTDQDKCNDLNTKASVPDLSSNNDPKILREMKRKSISSTVMQQSSSTHSSRKDSSNDHKTLSELKRKSSPSIGVPQSSSIHPSRKDSCNDLTLPSELKRKPSQNKEAPQSSFSKHSPQKDLGNEIKTPSELKRNSAPCFKVSPSSSLHSSQNDYSSDPKTQKGLIKRNSSSSAVTSQPFSSKASSQKDYGNECKILNELTKRKSSPSASMPQPSSSTHSSQKDFNNDCKTQSEVKRKRLPSAVMPESSSTHHSPKDSSNDCKTPSELKRKSSLSVVAPQTTPSTGSSQNEDQSMSLGSPSDVIPSSQSEDNSPSPFLQTPVTCHSINSSQDTPISSSQKSAGLPKSITKRKINKLINRLYKTPPLSGT